MIRLAAPSESLRASWSEAMMEFGSAHLHGFSTHRFEDIDLTSADGFRTWLDQMERNVTDPLEGFVLVTCDDDNDASRRTIERNGGMLEDVRDDKRRHWIACNRQ